MDVKVTVLKDHKFRGVKRTKGAVLNVTNREAKTLAAVGWVKIERTDKAKPEPKATPAKPRAYKRKDVPSSPEKAVVTPEPPHVLPPSPEDKSAFAFHWPSRNRSTDDGKE